MDKYIRKNRLLLTVLISGVLLAAVSSYPDINSVPRWILFGSGLGVLGVFIIVILATDSKHDE